jgi:hypothetical protein
MTTGHNSGRELTKRISRSVLGLAGLIGLAGCETAGGNYWLGTAMSMNGAQTGNMNQIYVGEAMQDWAMVQASRNNVQVNNYSSGGNNSGETGSWGGWVNSSGQKIVYGSFSNVQIFNNVQEGNQRGIKFDIGSIPVRNAGGVPIQVRMRFYDMGGNPIGDPDNCCRSPDGIVEGVWNIGTPEDDQSRSWENPGFWFSYSKIHQPFEETAGVRKGKFDYQIKLFLIDNREGNKGTISTSGPHHISLTWD